MKIFDEAHPTFRALEQGIWEIVIKMRDLDAQSAEWRELNSTLADLIERRENASYLFRLCARPKTPFTRRSATPEELEYFKAHRNAFC